jgi:probable F420-dependent oxidoreductase
MRFGFILPNLISPVANANAIITTARLAEQVGFDSIWATDHILMPDEFPQYGQGTEAITTLAYLAGITERIPLGLSVLVLPMRNPIIIAKELASLVHLSGREFILGVGVGWNRNEYGFLNADFGRRGKLLDEYVTILKTLWTQDHPEHEGTHKFSGVTFSPRLIPPPPIWVGGESDAAIERAAKIGDGYHPNYREHTDYGAVVRRIRELSGGRHVTMSVRISFDMREGAAAALDKLALLEEQGLEYPAVGFKHETLPDLTGAMESFARDVMPKLRA